MIVHTYHTKGGKDLMRTNLDELPKRESVEGYFIIESLDNYGID